MGEYADMAIEDGLAEDGPWFIDRPRFRPRTKTCKFCKAQNLRWGIHEETGGWRLYTVGTNALHTCLQANKGAST